MSEAYDELRAEFNRLTITLAYDVITADPAAMGNAERLLDLSRQMTRQVMADTDELIAGLRGALSTAAEIPNTHSDRYSPAGWETVLPGDWEVYARELRRSPAVHPPGEDLEP